MRKPWRGFLGAVAAALVVAAPLVYSASRQHHRRNLRVVEDGVLYRSGQLTPTGLAGVIDDYHVKTVVSLRANRDPGGPNPDAWEEDVCAARRLNYVRLVPKVWGADESGEVPADANVRRFVEVMDDPANHPVLVHCKAGLHRTGLMVAVYRMEYEGWSKSAATRELRANGFGTFMATEGNPYLVDFISNYEPGYRRGRQVSAGGRP
jgi:tyrosine-protein phosphatase SIW14